MMEPETEITTQSPLERDGPRFEIIRVSGDEHKLTRTRAKSAEEAYKWARRQEFLICGYQLPPDELQRIEQDEADPDVKLDPNDKGYLFVHRQEQPYDVVSVSALTEDGDYTGKHWDIDQDGKLVVREG